VCGCMLKLKWSKLKFYQK
jgi:hypothetical protein